MAQLTHPRPLTDLTIDRDPALGAELEHVVWQSALDLQDDRPADRHLITGIADLLVRHLAGPGALGPDQGPRETTAPPPATTADLLRDLTAASPSHLRQCGRLLLQRLMTRLTALDANARILTRVADAYFSCYDELARARDRAHQDEPPPDSAQRARLLKMVLARPLVSSDDIDALATALNWPIPDTVAIMALSPRPGAPARAPLGLPAEVLADFERDDPMVLLPHPEITGPRLERMLRPWNAAIGPAVPFEHAAISLRRARDLLDLLQAGILGKGPVARYDEHLATLLVFRDPELAESIVRLRLSPLSTLEKATADRLAGTLLAWIQHAGSVPATARHMHLHPQTVRYRMRQLEGLFGSTLQDPRQRLELEAALRKWLSAAAGRPAAKRPHSGRGRRPS